MSSSSNSGLTLLELLVVLALAAIMMGVAFPAWRSFEQRTTEHAFITFLLSSCEQARTTAISQRTETYMLFQHRQPAAQDRFCLLQQENLKKIVVITPWVTLPRHLSFLLTPESIMSETIPQAMLQALPENLQQEITLLNSSFAHLQWDARGSIIYPAVEDTSLVMSFFSSRNKSDKKSDSILFCRMTGKAQHIKKK